MSVYDCCEDYLVDIQIGIIASTIASMLFQSVDYYEKDNDRYRELYRLIIKFSEYIYKGDFDYAKRIKELADNNIYKFRDKGEAVELGQDMSIILDKINVKVVSKDDEKSFVEINNDLKSKVKELQEVL